MYETTSEKISTPVHIELAGKMATEIVERFSPTEQNEAIKRIYELIVAQRQELISKAEKEHAYLTDSLKELQPKQP